MDRARDQFLFIYIARGLCAFESLTVVLVIFACALAVHASNPGPVNCAQLLSWIAGGIPDQRLVRLVGERAITFQVYPRGPLKTRSCCSATWVGLNLPICVDVGNYNWQGLFSAVARALARRRTTPISLDDHNRDAGSLSMCLKQRSGRDRRSALPLA